MEKDPAQIVREYPETDENGRFRRLELRNTHREFGKHNRPNLYYPFFVDSGGAVFLKNQFNAEAVLPDWEDGFHGCWAWSQEKARSDLQLLVAEKVKGKWKIFRKSYAAGAERMLKTILASNRYYTEQGQRAFNELFDTKEKIFQSPKSPRLVGDLLATAIEPTETVLDFFSGSCTTAHAVLELNKQDGGNRKFIMVQLPEPCATDSEAFKAGYKNIAEVGKERIRRVIKKLNDEDATSTAKETQNPALFSSAGADESAAPGAPDRGFKVFKLDSSNIKTWDPNFSQLEHALLNATEKMKPDRTEADVIYEVLLKYGLDLTLPIEKRTIADRMVYIIGGGTLVVCLGMDMTLQIVEKIAELKDEFKPENPPGMRMVFKDNGFASDELKTNAVQILKQRGIEDVRAL